MNAERFVSEARKLIGAKWRHRGRKPWAVDCVGLVVLAAKNSGAPTDDEIGYGREPWEDRLRKGCIRRWGEPLPVTEARPGDVALIRCHGSEPSHMAVIGDHPSGGLTVIHSNTTKGVIETSITTAHDFVVIEVYRPWRLSSVD